MYNSSFFVRCLFFLIIIGVVALYNGKPKIALSLVALVAVVIIIAMIVPEFNVLLKMR